MKFKDYAFSQRLQSGIEKALFTECTPVQEKTFGYILEGRDVYAQSQTGTGKTAAFLISIFHLLESEKYKNRKALIVVPTRELAVQIKEEADILGQDMDFKVGCFYGGTGYKTQEDALETGVDIIISTPGRLLDFTKQGKIRFSDFSILVIDEADRLFDMGFVDDIRKIFNGTKNVEDKITLLFSATMNPNVGNISWEYMKNPGEIFIEPEQLTVEAIEQELYHVSKDEKMGFLLGILKRENPDSAIIFTNTKHMAYEISKRLERNGYSNKYIMGDLPQYKRLQVVKDLKSGKVKFLVATDVAARGLHIDDLSLVINYDLPIDSENYVHRIGRTARAGKTGKAINMACENFVFNLSGIEDYIDYKIPVCHVTDDLVLRDLSEGERFSLRESKNNDSRGPKKAPYERKRSKTSNTHLSDKERLDRVRNRVLDVSGTNSLEDASVSNKPKKKKIDKKVNTQTVNKPTRNKSSRPKDKYVKKDYSARPLEKRVTSTSKVEDRLEYYKKKYGEDFTLNNEKSDKKLNNVGLKSKGLFSRIKSIFSK